MQIIKLSKINDGIFKKIATAMIKEHGFYTCVYMGVKTKVVQ